MLQIKYGATFGPTGLKLLDFLNRYSKAGELYVTSAFRPEEPWSHHGGLTYLGSPTAAIDVGAWDYGQAEGSRRMRDFARWLEQFTSQLVELIHTTPYDTDAGFYVKNGKRFEYDAQTKAQHANHVHVASSLALIEKLLALTAPAPAPPPPPAPAPVPGLLRQWPAWMPAGHYFGLRSGPVESRGGATAQEQAEVRAIQQRLIALAWVRGRDGQLITDPNSPWADGDFGQPTKDAVAAWQMARYKDQTSRPGEVWRDDWGRLFDPNERANSAPPTPPPPPRLTPALKGWDASDYDHTRGMRASHIQAAAAEGVKFFTHKVSEHGEGGITLHHQYGPKVTAARDAGIPFLGAYVVVRSVVPIADQAATAIQAVEAATPWYKDHPGWFWQVDIELWEYDKVPANLGDELAAELLRRTGKPVILYASAGQYGNSIPNSGRVLWNADYRQSGTPGTWEVQWERRRGFDGPGWGEYSGRKPRIVQFASDCIIGGQATCDANAFDGTEADFWAMLGTQPAPEPQPEPEPEPTPGDPATIQDVYDLLTEVRDDVAAVRAALPADTVTQE